MDKTVKCIMKEHGTTRIKVDIGRKRRRFIRECYQSLKTSEEKPQMGICKNRDSLTIRIISKQLTSYTESPALQNLIGISDICFIDSFRGKFLIELTFNLWRWANRETLLTP